MTDYEKLLTLIDDERVNAGLSSNKDLGFKFTIGQTRYVWEHGTLGEGHEHLTPAQRYFQANREIYHISNNIEEQRFAAMEAKADMLEAEKALDGAITEPDKLKASAKLGRAKAKLRRALDNTQDAMRGLDTLARISQTLEPEVLSQYPNGIEQAEPDHWRAVFKYRALKSRMGVMTHLDSIPLPLPEKAQLGAATGRPDASAGLLFNQPTPVLLINKESK